MSCSGGYDGGGLAGGGGTDPCAQLSLRRVIEAPVQSAVATLDVGDVLTVALRGDNPPTVAVITSAGVDAGSIVPTTDLLACLQSGYSFDATVLSSDGGAIRVNVAPSP